MAFINSNNIPKYSSSDYDRLTQGLLSSIGTALPIDVDLLVEKMGIDIFPCPGIKQISATDAFLCKKEKLIYVEQNIPNVRMRFSIAHELGHLIMHEKVFDDLNFNSIEEWKEVIKNIDGWLWGTLERQADKFAGKLLAPKNLIIQNIANYREDILKAKKELGNEYEPLNEYLAIPLSKVFLVSEWCMKIRLQSENINPYEYV